MTSGLIDDDRIVLVQPRQFEPSAEEMAMSQILNRHAPDMERGFTIQTNYGDLPVGPGRLADRIRDLVEQHARLELMRLEVRQGEGA